MLAVSPSDWRRDARGCSVLRHVASDITKFNAQYGGLSVKTSMAFHDRFIIIDDKELYLIGASLKDLGKKCFGFTALDKSNIPDILAKI
jgi:hypothetical protein